MSDIPFVFTPVQVQHWDRLSLNDPACIVDALNLVAIDHWNDTTLDFFYCLSVLHTRASRNDINWSRLVDLGVVDALCNCVIHARAFPPTPQSITAGIQAKGSVPHHFLEVLCNVGAHFSEPPSQTDLKVLGTLRNYWSKMMLRIWESPEKSLRSESRFMTERRVVAKILLHILVVDIPFLSVIDNESDLTISVLSRYWLHATSGSDKFMNTSVMAEMMRPQAKPIRDYRALHPFPTTFFHRIMRGVSSSPKHFVSTSASRLSRIYGVEAYLEVLLFESAWHMASQGDHPLHTEFLEATRHSLPLWTNMFALLHRSAEEDQPDNTTDECNGTLVLPPIIFLAGAVTTNCSKMQGDSQRARSALMHIWARTEIISALSQSIMNGVLNNQEHDGWTTRSINAILQDMKISIDEDPSLLLFLSPQFPRQHVLATLKRLSTTFNPLNPATGDIPVNVGCWILFSELHKACVAPDLCIRRGCRQIPTARCTKCKSGYCSIRCQKQDWKEHKIACSLA